MTRERERIFVTNRACHCMSLMLVASWSNGNTRMTTTSISNFAICPTAVADRRKRRQICFFEIWEESCLFSKYVCVWKKRMSSYVCIYVLRKWCHHEPYIGTDSMMIDKNLFFMYMCTYIEHSCLLSIIFVYSLCT
jgi:hypothetical protein